MNRETIEKTAKEYAKDKYGGENAKQYAIAQIHAGRDGFIDGAQWRINSVWHDMKEEVPQIYGDYEDSIYPQIPCLVRGMLSTGYGYGVRYWNTTNQYWDNEERDDYECDKDKIEEWAYLDDLLPERKEKLNEKET